MRNQSPGTSGRAGASPPWESTPTGLRSEWRLAASSTSVTAMRWWLRAFLGQAGLSAEEIDDMVLAACEAADNAVEHAQQPREPFFDVRTEIDDGEVTIVIRDHGLWRQVPVAGDRGRGLPLMHALADTTVTASPDGTTVIIRNQRVAPEDPAADEGRAS